MSENEAQAAETPVVTDANEDKTKLSYEALQTELKKVREEAAGRRILTREQETKLTEYEEWKKSQLTEAEKLKLERDDAVNEAKVLKFEKAQANAARKAGLPTELADRIRGNSDEELLEDAKRLAAVVPAKTNTGNAGLFGAGERGAPAAQNAAQSANEYLFGRLLGS